MRKRLGNFIVAEDNDSLEGIVLARLKHAGLTLAIGETATGGIVAARIAPLAGAESVFVRGVIAKEISAEQLLKESGAGIALTVDTRLDEGADRPDFGATITIGIAGAKGTVSRTARLVGGREWVRVGACELGLDCLRRLLLGLPVDERVDFERR